MANVPATAGGAIPLPIVRLNRAVLVTGILGGLLLGQPLVTTVLFAVILSAVLFGPRGSLIFQVGKRLLARQNARARQAGHVEDRRLMRFTHTIAAALLGAAQVAFLAGYPAVGWACALMVAAAAAVALAGFCFGCFLYFRFKMYRYRLLSGT